MMSVGSPYQHLRERRADRVDYNQISAASSFWTAAKLRVMLDKCWRYRCSQLACSGRLGSTVGPEYAFGPRRVFGPWRGSARKP